jgi:hypothetical protein
MSAVKVFGRIRQLLQGFDQGSTGDDEQLALTEQLELLVALGASPYGEIVKIGRSFECHTTTAVAAVVAVPSTASLLQLWNGEQQGVYRTMIIDRIWALMAAGTAAAGQGAIIVAPGQSAVVAPASAGLAFNALNGNGSKDTKAVNSTAALDAATGVAANWRVAPGQTGGQKAGAAATPGVYINAEVNGRIMLPPGRAMGIHVLADVVGSTFTVGVEWHERYIKLG